MYVDPNGRQEDLSKVFDRRWKANHNDDVRRAKARDKKMMSRLYDVKARNNVITTQEQVKNLQKNMNAAYSVNSEARINKIRGNNSGRFI